MTKKIRILLADDHPPFLQAEAMLLKPHFELVGIVTNGEGLVSEALRLRPDVIVTDITMAVLSGIEAVIKLRRAWPTAKVVFLTVHSNEEFLKACMAQGAFGFVVKSHMKAQLIPAICAAFEERTYISLLTP